MPMQGCTLRLLQCRPSIFDNAGSGSLGPAVHFFLLSLTKKKTFQKDFNQGIKFIFSREPHYNYSFSWKAVMTETMKKSITFYSVIV